MPRVQYSLIMNYLCMPFLMRIRFRASDVGFVLLANPIGIYTPVVPLVPRTGGYIRVTRSSLV